MVTEFKNVWERSTAKNYYLARLLSVVSKSLKNLKIIGLLITWRNVAYFLISSMVLGLLDQLYLIEMVELLGLLIGLRLIEL